MFSTTIEELAATFSQTTQILYAEETISLVFYEHMLRPEQMDQLLEQALQSNEMMLAVSNMLNQALFASINNQ